MAVRIILGKKIGRAALPILRLQNEPVAQKNEIDHDNSQFSILKELCIIKIPITSLKHDCKCDVANSTTSKRTGRTKKT